MNLLFSSGWPSVEKFPSFAFAFSFALLCGPDQLRRINRSLTISFIRSVEKRVFCPSRRYFRRKIVRPEEHKRVLVDFLYRIRFHIHIVSGYTHRSILTSTQNGISRWYSISMLRWTKKCNETPFSSRSPFYNCVNRYFWNRTRRRSGRLGRASTPSPLGEREKERKD